jgi:hypothetical protein
MNITFETRFEELGVLEQIHREPGYLPFTQQGLEAAAQHATLRLNGEEIALILPGQTMNGAPAACWAPCGIYAR